MIVEGKEESTTTTNPTGSTGKEIIDVKAYGQPVAKQFDSSKATGATRLSTTNWNLAEVNRFKMNQADPSFVTGAYIDTFLRNFYSDSPLVGHGQ